MDGILKQAREATVAVITRDEKRVSSEVRRILRYLKAHFLEVGFGVEDVTLAFRQEAEDLIDTFSAELGVRLDDYIFEARLEVGLRLLVRSRLSANRISKYLGLQPAVFRTAVERHFGLRPQELRSVARIPVGSHSQALIAPLPKSEKARIVRCLTRQFWLLLEPMSYADQVEFVGQLTFAGAAELFECLSQKSREAGRRNLRRGVELAELALAIVEGSATLLGDHAAEFRLLALARLCNARRLEGDFKGADKEFDRIEAMPVGLELDYHVQAEVLFIQATLRLFERRFEEALQLLNESLTIAREIGNTRMQAERLLQRIELNRYQGRPLEMFPDLKEVRDLLASQAEPDRFLLQGVYQQWTLAYLETGQTAEAKTSLVQAKALNEELDHAPSRYQLAWIEGWIAITLCEEATAEKFLRRARIGFEGIAAKEAAALAALDLAVLCHGQGRFGEVTELVVCSVLPALAEMALADETRAATELLRSAVAAETISLAVLQKVRQALNLVVRGPCHA
jgi:AraC-like DNA-binding protein/tetratricopeptide (TPR) repeat protein